MVGPGTYYENDLSISHGTESLIIPIYRDSTFIDAQQNGRIMNINYWAHVEGFTFQNGYCGMEMQQVLG